MKKAFTTCLLVAGLLASGERPAQAEPPIVGDEQAKKWFVEGNHLDAAQAYEELWSRKREARFLFNAAMARELSGHELQAFVHLQRYLLIPKLTDGERQEAQDRLRALKGRTKQVRIIISPATLEAGALTLRLQRAPDGSTSDRGRPPMSLDGATMASIGVPGYDGAFDLYLEPGHWKAEVAADGYNAQTLSITIDAAKRKTEAVLRLIPDTSRQATVPVSTLFEPSRAVVAGIDVSLVGPTPIQGQVDTPTRVWNLQPGKYTLVAKAPRFRRKQISFTAHDGLGQIHVSLAPERRYGTIVLGVVASAALVTGAVVSTVYGRQLKDTLEEFEGDTTAGSATAAVAHRGDIARNWSRRAIGMRLVGAGIGVGIGALTSALEHRVKRPERIYVGEAVASAGLAAVALGLAWALPRRDFGDSLDALYCGNPEILQDDSDYCTSGRTGRLNLTDPTNPITPVRHTDVDNLFGGLGVGLFAASVTSLVKLAVDRRAAPPNVTVSSFQGGIRVNF